MFFSSSECEFFYTNIFLGGGGGDNVLYKNNESSFPSDVLLFVQPL